MEGGNREEIEGRRDKLGVFILEDICIDRVSGVLRAFLSNIADRFAFYLQVMVSIEALR